MLDSQNKANAIQYVKTLREERNKLGHDPRGDMDDNQFSKKWKEIAVLIVELAKETKQTDQKAFVDEVTREINILEADTVEQQRKQERRLVYEQFQVHVLIYREMFFSLCKNHAARFRCERNNATKDLVKTYLFI